MTMEADPINDWEMTAASNPVNIVVVGKAGNDKSATGNSILGREVFISKLSPSGVTCTSELQGTILNDGRIINMDLQNAPMTVQLGRGARIQLANAVIETRNTGATIQFGSVDFPAVVARASGAPTRRVHLPAPRPAAENSRGKISVFERLSQPEALTTRRIVNGGKVSVVTINTTTLPTRLFAPGKYDAETPSSGGRPTRRQRRRMNAELRAQHQQLPVHPSNLPALVPEVNVPTRNKFSDLKWVKRNSSTGELKKSFWEQRREAPAPPRRKEPETLSARVYRVLKTVKEKGLKKKKFQRPLVIEARRTPLRERLSFTTERRERRQNQRGEHRGVTPEPYVQGSTAERSRWKGKQVWRPKPRRNEKDRREGGTDLGVTSGEASRRSAPIYKQRQKWAPKKTHNDIPPDGRHLGESSRGSRRLPSPPKEETNFDRSPLVEEVLVPNQEPKIQWRRRSEIRVLEDEGNMQGEDNIEEDEFLEEDKNIQEYLEGDENIEEFMDGNLEEELKEINDTLDMEVVYMVRHANTNDETYYDDDEGDDDQ
ncbi:hypothetical protein KFK09_024452 [Dendrobium nobile]|uniref:AIG1-type G domain-containing protein n=1 Tax=Dendrobium nobile TaxID=94219 RepID=A0A8T3ADV5_DENNO|nr:hypothetical protein KFK09_024452 [Dendrobium nobile]